jgi:hypothetical protein
MRTVPYNNIMGIGILNSRIDAFLLTVDFRELNVAWFAQFDQGGRSF